MAQRFQVLNGDSLELLNKLEANSIDACVCDPPYELGFMGKKWDATGIANNVELWRNVLRVLKPGAHLIAFGGTRTYHRMVEIFQPQQDFLVTLERPPVSLCTHRH